MMEMPLTLRPGVYAQVQAHAAASGDYPRFAAAVGAAGADAPDEVRLIHSLSDAAALGTDSALYRMVAAMLEAQPAPVYAVAAKEDYTAALAKLEGLPVAAIACDGGEAALLAHVQGSAAAGQERLGVLAAGTPDEAVAAAGRCNHPHLVVVCDGTERTAQTAAAFAAMVAGLGAGGSLNGLPVCAAGEEPPLSAAVVEELLRAGVTPFEPVGKQLCCVRARTTATSRDGVPDGTFADLSAVLAADEVVDAVRRAVRIRLRGLKNNADTRDRIATQIVVELEEKRLEGLIDSYQLPVVRASAQDAAVCLAEIRFRIAPEISQIVLQTQIVM